MTGRRTVRIVVHGKAAGRPEIRGAVATLRERGHAVEVRVTWEGGDAALFAIEAATQGIDTVVAGGGDGTINEVASGLLGAVRGLGRCPSLGILPLGTANDFARSAGIPLEPRAALELVTAVEPVAVDVGRADDRVFVNVATGGFGTQVTARTPEPVKKLLGGAAYLVTGLTRFSSIRPVPTAFTGPEFSWEGPVLVMAVGNGRQAGGGHVLCPDATVDDGLLDLRILPDVPREELGGVLQRILTGGIDALESIVVSARLPWVEVEAAQPIQVNLDGEPISSTACRFDVLPGALRIHLPEGCPLVGG